MNYKGCVPIIFVLTLLPSFLNAQEMNDEFKKRMRESIMMPDNPPPQLLQHQNPLPLELQRENSEVLKVSPFTRLPTKYDIFLQSSKPVELEVKMHIIPSNAPPINMRPASSTEIVHESGKMSVRSNGGELVNPSGMDFDPVRSIKNRRLEKRRKRLQRMLDAY